MLAGVKKRRFHYRLSWVLFGLLVFVTLFGSYLMPHYISSADKIPYLEQVVHGVKKHVPPPYAPNGTFWLGTDHRGYDVLSLLLNGAKYTMGYALLITLLRFLLAVPLGLYAGVTGKGRNGLSTMQLITSSVPALLFIFPAIYGLNKVLPTNQTDLILFVMLVVFGIFQVAHLFANRAEFFSGKLFVTASQTMGASTSRIVFRHLLPHLRPEILFAFLTELVQVLFLIGQLAVVNVFLGGGENFELDDGSPFSPKIIIQLTTTGEWGGMIAYGIRMIMNYPWILLSAGVFFAVAILILTFFSKQLQLRFDQPVLYRAKQPLQKNKPVLSLGGVSVATCVLLLALAPNKAPTPVIKEANAVKTATATSQGVTSTALDQKIADQVKNVASSFMGYVAQNQWSYADAYVHHKKAEQYVFDSQPPEPPFTDWLKQFASKTYTFTSIGQVKQMGNGEDHTYIAEVLVKDAAGKSATWTVEVVLAENNRYLIDSGKSGN
jgi:peptide/nickel transport system permease protein